MEWFSLVDSNRTVEIMGVKLIGANAENGKKLLVSIGLIIFLVLLSHLLNKITGWLLARVYQGRINFWIHQGIRVVITVILILGLISLWFDNPARLATAAGLVGAGLAFALQKVITALAGYIVILRGKIFNVGDRIRMGGVRGDVIALDFIKTTIMEMGQPPPVQNDEPAMWVKSRQYTGRLVAVSNAAIFDEPVYNYSRDFPYIWEEMSVPVRYNTKYEQVEKILLQAAERHTARISEISARNLAEIERRYFIKAEEIKPRVYFRFTDNWLELTVRYIVEDHGMRETKDAMSREILKALDEAGIGIASSTFEIVGVPPLRLEHEPRH